MSTSHAGPGGDPKEPDITPGREEPTPLRRREDLPAPEPSEPRRPEPTELPERPPETPPQPRG